VEQEEEEVKEKDGGERWQVADEARNRNEQE